MIDRLAEFWRAYRNWVTSAIRNIWAEPVEKIVQDSLENPFSILGTFVGAIAGVAFYIGFASAEGLGIVPIVIVLALAAGGFVGFLAGNLMLELLINVWRAIRTGLVLAGPPILAILGLQLAFWFIQFLFTPL